MSYYQYGGGSEAVTLLEDVTKDQVTDSNEAYKTKLTEFIESAGIVKGKIIGMTNYPLSGFYLIRLLTDLIKARKMGAEHRSQNGTLLSDGGRIGVETEWKEMDLIVKGGGLFAPVLMHAESALWKLFDMMKSPGTAATPDVFFNDTVINSSARKTLFKLLVNFREFSYLQELFIKLRYPDQSFMNKLKGYEGGTRATGFKAEVKELIDMSRKVRGTLMEWVSKLLDEEGTWTAGKVTELTQIPVLATTTQKTNFMGIFKLVTGDVSGILMGRIYHLVIETKGNIMEQLEQYVLIKFLEGTYDIDNIPITDENLEKIHSQIPIIIQEVRDMVKMKHALADAFQTGDITKITKCLGEMGETWGDLGSSETHAPTTTTTAPKTTPPSGTSTTVTVSGDNLDLSKTLPVPVGKETLDNLVQSIQTYLMTISIPTSNPTIEKVKPFIYNIYRALMDAHRATMVQVFNVEEVLSIIEGDKTFKDGFSANNTSIIRRKWSKKDRHITIRLVKENKLYDNLPSARGTGEQIDPGGEEFKKLSDFTLKLWKVLGETPGNIHQYFQNLGDTKIEITQEGYEITYIVLGQFSKLNLLARGRTDDIVKRLKSSVRNKAEVNLGEEVGEELGGDDGIRAPKPVDKYNIFLLERTDSDTLVSNIPQKDDEFTLELKPRGVLPEILDTNNQTSGSLVDIIDLYGSSASWVVQEGTPTNILDIYFNESLSDDPQFKDIVGSKCANGSCVLVKINDIPLYLTNKYDPNKISTENLKRVFEKIKENLPTERSRVTTTMGRGKLSSKPLTFTFKHIPEIVGGGIFNSLLYGGHPSDPDRGPPGEMKDRIPVSDQPPTVSLKVDDSWKNIPVSKEEKKLLENLSKYSINSGVAQDQGAQELVKGFNFVSQLLKSNNEEILGAPISDKPDPKDKSDKDKGDKGDGDKGDGDNTESAEMKKLKAELEAQKQAQATAIATQNTQALAAAQRQSTQLQSQINQQTRQNQNTGRPNQNTGQSNQNTGRANQNTGQSNIRSAQQGLSSAQQGPRSAQQGPISAQQGPISAQSNIRSAQQPGEKRPPPGEKLEQPGEKPEQPGEQSRGPSFIERLLGSSGDIDKQKEELKSEKDDFEKQKEDEIKTKERMKKLQEEEVIQTDLFKQLPDKSSPEYERVKKMMIAQIKLIHKYNLLKQESFKLMVENSKCEKLEEENKVQKEQIKDQENKIFNIIQQILGSKGSNKGSNKLNKDLLGYIDDLKSNNPDGSLVDAGKYLELMNSSEDSHKNKTLKKYKHKQPVNSKKKKSIAKRNNTKKTPTKYIKKRTPKKSKFIGAKKGRRTPIKPKN